MASNPVFIARTLSAIVADLATTNQRLSVHYTGLGEPTQAEHREWDALEDRKYALEREMDAAIYLATGVSWHLLQEVRA